MSSIKFSLVVNRLKQLYAEAELAYTGLTSEQMQEIGKLLNVHEPAYIANLIFKQVKK